MADIGYVGWLLCIRFQLYMYRTAIDVVQRIVPFERPWCICDVSCLQLVEWRDISSGMHASAAAVGAEPPRLRKVLVWLETHTTLRKWFWILQGWRCRKWSPYLCKCNAGCVLSPCCEYQVCAWLTHVYQLGDLAWHLMYTCGYKSYDSTSFVKVGSRFKCGRRPVFHCTPVWPDKIQCFIDAASTVVPASTNVVNPKDRMNDLNSRGRLSSGVPCGVWTVPQYWGC